METQLKKIKNQLNNSNNITNINTQKNYNESNQTVLKPEILFLPSPNSDGNFDETTSSLSYKEGATIYRFIKTEQNKANFQIDDKEASIKLALQYRDKRIDPVCESINAFNQSKRIITLEQGEAELQNGKWVVNKKAKISYEG